MQRVRHFYSGRREERGHSDEKFRVFRGSNMENGSAGGRPQAPPGKKVLRSTLGKCEKRQPFPWTIVGLLEGPEHSESKGGKATSQRLDRQYIPDW